MRKILFATLLALTATFPALAADVGVSINLGQPGFYGRIDLGDAPQPQLVYRQPRIIHRTTVVEQPVYLRVPPGQRKNWGRYCSRYNACGQPVYFVQDNWYNNVYAPQYRERHGDRGHDDRKDDRKDDRRDDRHDDHRDHDDHGRDHH